jgi:hypothetical protein
MSRTSREQKKRPFIAIRSMRKVSLGTNFFEEQLWEPCLPKRQRLFSVLANIWIVATRMGAAQVKGIYACAGRDK